MSFQDTKELNRRFYEEVMNTGDVSLVGRFFASHVAEMQLIVAKLHQAFTGLHFTIEDQIGEEDKLVTRWTVTGTHTSEWEGYLPSGQFVKWTGTSTQRYKGGKVVEYWNEENLHALRQQLQPKIPGEAEITRRLI